MGREEPVRISEVYEVPDLLYTVRFRGSDSPDDLGEVVNARCPFNRTPADSLAYGADAKFR
jgi:hypothetical protein